MRHHPLQLPQAAFGSTQALAHDITKDVATTATPSAVSLVGLTRGERVAYVGVKVPV